MAEENKVAPAKYHCIGDWPNAAPSRICVMFCQEFWFASSLVITGSAFVIATFSNVFTVDFMPSFSSQA